MSDQLPDIKILHALTPKDQGEYLAYPNIETSIAEYAPDEPRIWTAFSDAEHGSIDEEDAARRIAKISLIHTANIGLTSGDSVWAERLTNDSAELYDGLEGDTWQQCVDAHLEQIQDSPHKDVYVDALKGAGVEISAEFTPMPEVAAEWQVAFAENNDAILESIPEQDVYSATDLWSIACSIRTQLAVSEDEDWVNWSVVLKNGDKGHKVIASEKTVSIGAESSGKQGLSEVQELMAHEVLTHARRAARGYNKDDYMVATGLPDYLDAEEGLATIAKTMCGTPLPIGALTRYIDHGLAAGLAGKSVSRQTMNEIVKLRQKAISPELDDKQAAKKAATYTKRVYRGGTGDQADGEPQAMILKDTVYVSGYIKMVGYINEQLAAGVEAGKLWTYLHAGKFDPTKQAHVTYMKNLGVTL